jgi:hypothetical protein
MSDKNLPELSFTFRFDFFAFKLIETRVVVFFFEEKLLCNEIREGKSDENFFKVLNLVERVFALCSQLIGTFFGLLFLRVCVILKRSFVVTEGLSRKNLRLCEPDLAPFLIRLFSQVLSLFLLRKALPRRVTHFLMKTLLV